VVLGWREDGRLLVEHEDNNAVEVEDLDDMCRFDDYECNTESSRNTMKSSLSIASKLEIYQQHFTGSPAIISQA